uniref:Uncharacterized protein n=1 Tax=Anopheles farauti TaxID=69004 RepID=A0A182QHE3_9DIPT
MIIRRRTRVVPGFRLRLRFSATTSSITTRVALEHRLTRFKGKSKDATKKVGGGEVVEEAKDTKHKTPLDLPVAKVARRLALEQRQADGTPQTGPVPGAAVDVEEVLIGDRFPAGGAYPQLSL